jgi:branched-chain amino acid transport system substrate-binding protein
VIRETGLYGDGLAQVFHDRFAAGGGTASIESMPDETKIGELVAKAAAADAQEVLFISSQQEWVIRFLNAASSQQAFAAKGIFLTDAAANQAVLDGAAAAAPLFPRVRGTRPAPRGMNDYVFASFAADYMAEYAEDATTTTFSAHSYDGAWLVLYGSVGSLWREGAVTGSGIARTLRKLSTGTTTTPIIPSSWPSVLMAFRAGKPVNLSGASGELDFDPVTKNVTAPIQIWRIDATGAQPAIAQVTTWTPGN